MNPIIKCLSFCCALLIMGYSLAAQPALTRVEYYIDSDPGYNNGNAVSFSAGAKNLSNISINLDPASITTGVHVLGIRSKDANEAWSQDNKWIFIKPFVIANGAVPNLSRIEYYIDTDPGYGLATSVSFAAGTNLNNILLNINPLTLVKGVHVLGIRARDANGSWSLDNKWVFLNPISTGLATPPNLKKVEYYIDNDPGYGNATPVSIVAGVNLSDLTINLNPASLNTGAHVLGIRSRDSKGVWSFDNKWLFLKPFTFSNPVSMLSNVEYYIDNDPGYGNGVPVAINNVSGLADFNLMVNISGLSASNHKLFIRSKDINNAWSLDNVFNFNVTAFIPNPSIIVNSVSKKVLCAKDTLLVSYQANGSFIPGNQFNVELSDSIGGFTTPTIIGTYTGTGNAIVPCKIPDVLPTSSLYRLRVSSTLNLVTGKTGNDTLIISNTMAAPGLISGAAFNLCSGGSNINYSIAAVPGALSYTWTVPANCIITNGQGTTSIKITVPANFSTGNISVVANGNCASGTPSTLTISGAPGSTSKINGLKTVASGQAGLIYNVNATAGLTYQWTVPADALITAGQGTNSITVTWGSTSGNVTVVASNSCGSSPIKKQLVTVAPSLFASNHEIGNHVFIQNVMVYPNPTKGLTTLAFTSLKETKYTLLIADMKGKILLSKTWTAIVGMNRVPLDLSNYANGIYLTNLISNENKQTFKIVKGN